MFLKSAVYLMIIVFISVGLAYGLTIETKKGDVIIGNLAVEKLKIQPDFGGVIEVPIREIAGLSGEENKYIFKMQDGSTLKGKIADEKLLIKTKFGEITVPIAEIKKITLEAAKLVQEKLAKEETTAPKDFRKFDVKKPITVIGSFEYSFESLEIKGENMIISIGFKNISGQIRSIALTKPANKLTVLLDEEGFENNLIDVKGLSDHASVEVNPGAKKIANFTFQVSKKIKKGKFVINVWQSDYGNQIISAGFGP